jgi:TonB family protein
MNAFVVTTSVLGSSRTQLWEGSKPLALGHPFRWVLERNEQGLRIRDLSGEAGKIVRGKTSEISLEQVASGKEVEIDVASGFKFKIRSACTTAPIFQNAASGGQLRIYRCVGNWAMDSENLAKNFIARIEGKTAFHLRPVPTNESWSLKVATEGLKLKDASGALKALNSGEVLELPTASLARSEILSLTGTSWVFGLTGNPEFADSTKAIAEEDTEWFKKSLKFATAGLLLLAVIACLWPAPKKDMELLPAQYAQILTPKPQKAAAKATAESGSAAPTAQEAPKKVREAAVVQAFRAKALSNAVNGLLKGGMTKLLAQSEFIAGSTHSTEARRILDTSNTSLQPMTALSSLTGTKNVQIASVGGDAHGEGGHSVGYGKGEHASIKGQGKGFVPFVQADASGAIVDEGLTREEVGEVIHRHLSEIRYCYESAMLRSPDIEGKLMVAFTINAAGAVKTAEAKSSTLPDPRLDDCIIRRLNTWPFPKPRGGVEVSVTYPFIFKTLGR